MPWVILAIEPLSKFYPIEQAHHFVSIYMPSQPWITKEPIVIIHFGTLPCELHTKNPYSNVYPIPKSHNNAS